MNVKSQSEVAQLCPTLSDLMAAAYQAPPSMGFSRQEYLSGVPLPSPYYLLSTYNELLIAKFRLKLILAYYSLKYIYTCLEM